MFALSAQMQEYIVFKLPAQKQEHFVRRFVNESNSALFEENNHPLLAPVRLSPW